MMGCKSALPGSSGANNAGPSQPGVDKTPGFIIKKS
jgi:hypothetical protein